jgi:serine/threonine-protein kinase RsbW
MKWWKSQGTTLKEHISVKSDLTVLNQVLEWFDDLLFRHKSKLSWLADQSDRQYLALDEIKLALDEGFTNAVRHAHKKLPPETLIEIQFTLWDDRLEIRIWDRGEPFDPTTLPEPKPGTLQEGGFGWSLIRRLTDRVSYDRGEDGRNCLLLVKRKPK